MIKEVNHKISMVSCSNSVTGMAATFQERAKINLAEH